MSNEGRNKQAQKRELVPHSGSLEVGRDGGTEDITDIHTAQYGKISDLKEGNCLLQ